MNEVDPQQVLASLLQQVGLESWVIQVFTVIFVTAVLSLVMRRIFERIHRGLERTATILG